MEVRPVVQGKPAVRQRGAQVSRDRPLRGWMEHRFAVTRWRRKVNSNCRYRFLNWQTTASSLEFATTRDELPLS